MGAIWRGTQPIGVAIGHGSLSGCERTAWMWETRAAPSGARSGAGGR